MQDKQGREYAKLSALKAGDTITVDGDFTCLKPWSKHVVKVNSDGLFVDCVGGHHLLSGQADNGEDLVGVYL